MCCDLLSVRVGRIPPAGWQLTQIDKPLTATTYITNQGSRQGGFWLVMHADTERFLHTKTTLKFSGIIQIAALSYRC